MLSELHLRDSAASAAGGDVRAPVPVLFALADLYLVWSADTDAPEVISSWVNVVCKGGRGWWVCVRECA